MDPKASVNPAISVQIRAVQMYGSAASLVRRESRPNKMTLVYVSRHPMMIILFKYGLDILMYLQTSRKNKTMQKSRKVKRKGKKMEKNDCRRVKK